MSPSERLEKAIAKAAKNLGKRDCANFENIERIEFIAGYSDNRAPIRLLLACTLAKLDNPINDPRKPYTEIGTPDCFRAGDTTKSSSARSLRNTDSPAMRPRRF